MREVLSEGDYYIRLARRRIHSLEETKKRLTGIRPDRMRRARILSPGDYDIRLARRRTRLTDTCPDRTRAATMREALPEGDYYIRLARHQIRPLEETKDRLTGTCPDQTRQATMREGLSEGYYVFQKPIRLARRRNHLLEGQEREKTLEGKRKDHLTGTCPDRTRRAMMRKVLSEGE